MHPITKKEKTKTTETGSFSRNLLKGNVNHTSEIETMPSPLGPNPSSILADKSSFLSWSHRKPSWNKHQRHHHIIITRDTERMNRNSWRLSSWSNLDYLELRIRDFDRLDRWKSGRQIARHLSGSANNAARQERPHLAMSSAGEEMLSPMVLHPFKHTTETGKWGWSPTKRTP